MDVAGVSAQRPRTFLYWNENFFFVYFVARLPSLIATGKCIYIEAPRLSQVKLIGCFLQRLLNVIRTKGFV